MDLLLALRSDLGPQAAVEHAIRDAIVEGALQPGAALPSTCALAAELGLARGTVVAAIEQLSAEGILETRPDSTTRVAHVPSSLGPVAPARSAPTEVPVADSLSGDPWSPDSSPEEVLFVAVAGNGDGVTV